MKKLELEIEHRYKNRFVGRYRLKGDHEITVLGSSREADIRLLGDGVQGVHAAVEKNESGIWMISDLGSEHGTWVKKKPIVSKLIQANMVLRIGGHHLRLAPKMIENEIFKTSGTVNPEDTNHEKYHQVIVRKLGVVVTTELLPQKKNYKLLLGREEHVIEPAKSFEWVSFKFGADIVVQHRLVSSYRVTESLVDRMKNGTDSSMKTPAMVAAALMGLMILLIMFSPKDLLPELNELKPDVNKYTKMIYDAKAIRKKRALAQKNKVHISGRSSRSNQKMKKLANAPKVTTKSTRSPSAVARVITKINASGLKRLLGKISSRRAKVATFIKSTGRTANNKGLGSARASLSATGTSKGSKSAKKFRISGVATSGKAGGVKNFKGVGGLAMGNVGNASVGVLEEETDVQGGLERDVIARVISSQLGQIRYCYERQLSASPDLYGKVLIKFTIGAQGSVVTQNVGLTTLKSAMVEGCILRRVARWRFPQPKGGTAVLVTYPFLFKSTN